MNIRLANRSPYLFHGWIRRTIDEVPQMKAGISNGCTWVLGSESGGDTWFIDVLAKLAPGEEIKMPIEGSQAVDFPEIAPFNPLEKFGGPMTWTDQIMDLIGYRQDGACIWSHCRKRAGATMCLDVWSRWYPGEGYAVGVAKLTSSNPAVEDMVESTSDIMSKLRFGDAVIHVGGHGILQEGGNIWGETDRWLGDGQSRIVPLTFIWPRLLNNDPQQWVNVAAVTQLKIGGNGLSRGLYPQGTPRLAPGFDAGKWAAANYPLCEQTLRTWMWPPLGPNARSGDTGSQEDQCLVGAEPLQFAGAEIPMVFASYAMGQRPCQHKEADGSMLDPARHPKLVFWDGRPHWHTGVSPDRLGKPRGLELWESHNRGGPDVEHPMMFRLCAAHRITGDDALQELIRQQAITYLLQWTIDPSLSTSQAYAARARGWEAANVMLMDRELRDRNLAAQVMQRFRLRVQQLIIPQWLTEGATGDVRVDPRLGDGPHSITWQNAVGAYWDDVAGERYGLDDLRAAVAPVAQWIVDNAWHKLGAGTAARALPTQDVYTGLVDGDGFPIRLAAGIVRRRDSFSPDMWVSAPAVPTTDPQSAPADGSFNYFGMSLAPACVLRRGENPKARELWNWLVANMQTEGQAKWMPPEVA